jgi:enterochelin esterase family protein
VAPGIYSYVFSVDGVQTVDKANPVTKSGTELYSSMVEVPGDRPRFDEIQNVPHGVKQLIRYTSTPLRRLRAMTVYLPPQYDTHLTEKFPVLYLRHGGGDNETSWSQPAGRADIILENLLAAQKAVPMIIVMTNGLTDGTWAGGSTPEGMKALEEELLVDVIPLVEHRFRVKKQAGARAIAGLSMGGGQSLVIGLRHPELFSWIGEFSSGLLSDKDFNMDTQWPGIMNASLNNRVKLLWIGCGTDDPRFPGHLDLVNNLQKRNIHYEFATVPGGHEWRVWRVSLHGFLQKIFREPVVYSKGTLQL